MTSDFDILMIATGSDHHLLDQLLGSLSKSVGTQKVGLVLIKQGEAMEYTDTALSIFIIHSKERISLSKARNTGIKHIQNLGITSKHVLFPDDDTTFDTSFFEFYAQKIKAGQAYLGRVCTKENGEDYKHYPSANSIKGTIDLLPYVASVSLVIPFPLMFQVGFFNENLGAGAKWASSEDLDYFIRCCSFLPFTYVRGLKNFHPGRFKKYKSLSTSSIKKRFKGYTDGYLFVLYKYHIKEKVWQLPIRALGGALISLLKLHFRLIPVYLWLIFYRLQMMRYFRKKQKDDPQFFST